MNSNPESAVENIRKEHRDSGPVVARVFGGLKSLTSAHSELWTVSLLVGCCLLVGLLTFRDYGVSWDEPDIYTYARYALKAYQFFTHPADLPLFRRDLNLYGPAYFMAADLFSRLVQLIQPAWSGITAWHLAYFLTFLAGVVFLYLLCRRSLSPLASLGACLLFVTQPLLWGHAFINPKDLPFMTMFLASMYLGLAMADRCLSARPDYLLILSAGVVLGLTTSFRPVAPFAGLLVAIYAVTRSPRKAVPLMLAYGLMAIITSYLTWPYLWASPLRNFTESLQTMSRFPYPGKTLFMGHAYSAYGLPWFYVPVLLGIQLTVPAILLAPIGLFLAVWRFRQPGHRPDEPLLLFIAWFLLPLIAIIVFRTPLYNNARQVLFLVPPLFVLMGVSLDALAGLLRSRAWMSSALLVCALPGIYGAVQLHPYEYIYYNQLIGGTPGASRGFEMDYWVTSARDMVTWLNTYAPRRATVWSGGTTDVLQPYLRQGLIVTCTSMTDCGGHYDYAALRTNAQDLTGCPAGNAVFSVHRLGVLLALVKHLPPGATCR